MASGWLLGLLLPLPIPLSFDARLSIGIAILAAAFVVASLAFREMIRARTPFEPNRTPLALVTRGPFRFSRNPLYVSLVSVAAGIGVLLGSWWLVLGAVVLAVLLNWRVIPIEERNLAARFPEDYAAYRKSTRRWL